MGATFQRINVSKVSKVQGFRGLRFNVRATFTKIKPV